MKPHIYKNEYLDRIKISHVQSVVRNSISESKIGWYGLVIEFKDGAIDKYEYCNRIDRNKDFLTLTVLLKRKEKING